MTMRMPHLRVDARKSTTRMAVPAHVRSLRIVPDPVIVREDESVMRVPIAPRLPSSDCYAPEPAKVASRKPARRSAARELASALVLFAALFAAGVALTFAMTALYS